MFGGVIGDSVLPATPENPQPGAPQNSDRVGMVEPPRAGGQVDASSPGMVMPCRVGKARDGVSEAFVAGPAEADGVVFAGLFGHGGLAGVGGECVAVG